MQLSLKINGAKPYEQAWKTKKRYVIRIGGRGGGRSYDVSLFIGAKLFQTATKFRGAIMRSVHEDIRHSIWQEMKDRLTDWEIDDELQKRLGLRFRDSSMELEYGLNSIHAHAFHQSSGDRTAKLKSLAGYTHAFIEEAEEVGETEFQQLDDSLRSDGSQIHLTLNTTSRNHWIVERWFDLVPVKEAPNFYKIELKPQYANDVEVVFCTHEDNVYIPQAVHTRYEQYKETKPDYYWQVIRGYAPETILGRIYTNWRKIDAIPFEARLLGHYLDFGFDPDPLAVGSVYYHNGGYIVDEKLYVNGMLNVDLARHLKLLPPAPIIADSAEPKSIAELARFGVTGIIGAEKGKESVYFGIKHVQGMKISYTAQSTNIANEYENYAWKVEKKTGDILGVEDPKCANHHMSGIRYFMTTMIKGNADPEADARRRRQQVAQHNSKPRVNIAL